MSRLITVFIALTLFQNATYASEEWEYSITPYGWIPTFETSLSSEEDEDVESEDSSFFDILDSFFLVSGEAWKGKWGVIGEFNYLALSDDYSALGGRLSGELQMHGRMASLALAYRIQQRQSYTLAAFGGLRYWDLDFVLDYDRDRSDSSISKDWLDPVIGLQANYVFSDQIYSNLIVDMGGFNVGSEFQWNLVANVGYRFTETISAQLGYRHLDVKFDEDHTDIDMEISGPYVALRFDF